MSRLKILKHSSVLILLTLGSRVMGLVREIVKADYLGTTGLSDAFTIAFMIPNLLGRLFAEGSMTAAFIPTLKRYFIEDDKKKIKEFLSSMLTFLTLIISLTVIICIIFTPYIVGLTRAVHPDTVFLTRFMFPYLAFISIAAFFQGMLNCVNIFAPTGVTPIIFNICVVFATIFLSPYLNNPARAMAVGVLIGGSIQAFFQLPYVLKAGFRFTFTGLKKAFTNEGTRKVLKLIAHTIIGMAAYQINILVSLIFATWAGKSIASSYQFSLRFQELMLGILAVSIGCSTYQLSENAKKLEWDKFNRNMIFAMNITSIITIPAGIFKFFNDQSSRYGFTILAYCLMTKHVHLFAVPEKDDTSPKQLVKLICNMHE